MMRWFIMIAFGLLSACVSTTGTQQPQPAPQQQPQQRPADPGPVTQADVTRFQNVVQRMEPLIERECRQRTQNTNCDFRIVVDRRPAKSPNAFQTLERNGRPVIGFNLALIAAARNSDEIAFVMGHEAAHHISGHLARVRQNATVGAIILGGLVAATGAGSAAVEQATNVGGSVGARSYSKEFELEADALGTIITHNAGYDPVRGAEFFSQIPDPGDQFLGTHPPNAQRVATVKKVASQL